MNKEIFLDRKPIFIVGCPRSGTTILASLLNAHSEIAASTETHFFNFVSKQNKYDWRDFDENQMHLMLEEARIIDFCKHLEIEGNDLIKIFVEDFGSAELCQENLSKEEFYRKKVFNLLIKALLEKKGKLRFCEKTPQHLMNVKEIIKLYPNAKIINIVRDGRDVVNSLVKMPWRPPGLINNSRFWKQYIEKGQELEQELNADKQGIPDNLLTIRFENLIKEPETVLKNICGFIGVSYEKSMLNKSSSNNESIFNNWESNWKHKSREDLDSTRISAWKKEMSDQDQIILCWHQQKLLKSLDYDVTSFKVSFFDMLRIVQEYLSLFFKKIFRIFTHIVN